jgi:hypothetical protein
MKNITLSADENLIEQARLTAKAQRKTLNSAFREWLRCDWNFHERQIT